MKRNLPNEEWIKRGCQRRAVVSVLNRPMSASQIVGEAKKKAPRIQLRDLWLILKQMQERDLVACLNPDTGNGKLFRPMGVLSSSCGSKRAIGRYEADLYSWLQRGAARRKILDILAGIRYEYPEGSTSSEIRSRGARESGIGKNTVLRTVNELAVKQLVKAAPPRKRSRQKCYKLTELARKFLDERSD